MSNGILFGIGAFVTFLVGTGMGLLLWGAILDGRYNETERLRRQVRDLEAEKAGGSSSGRRPPPRPDVARG